MFGWYELFAVLADAAAALAALLFVAISINAEAVEQAPHLYGPFSWDRCHTENRGA